jgi:hypothetical protein
MLMHVPWKYYVPGIHIYSVYVELLRLWWVGCGLAVHNVIAGVTKIFSKAFITALVAQSFWLQIQRSQVRFPVLPDFLSSSGSGTGSTQPREVNWGATWIKRSSGSRCRKQRLTAVGIRCAGHVTPLYPQKLALTSPTGSGHSVGIVRSRTKATEWWIPSFLFSGYLR